MVMNTPVCAKQVLERLASVELLINDVVDEVAISAHITYDLRHFIQQRIGAGEFEAALYYLECDEAEWRLRRESKEKHQLRKRFTVVGLGLLTIIATGFAEAMVSRLLS